MSELKILEGKRLLIVDDEPDVLETLEELLDMCDIDTAANFETAEKLLKQNKYDAAILDIMGVRGHDLLEIANQNGIPAMMLTAHALSPDNFAKSFLAGAKAYIPKEKMTELPDYLADFIKTIEAGKKPFKWFFQLKAFFDSKFGKDWLEKYNEIKKEFGSSFDD